MEQVSKQKEIGSVHSKCKNCGGNLVFCPTTQDLICAKCESHYPIENNGKILVHNLYDSNETKKHNKSFKEQNTFFKCKNCGANIVLNNYEISNKCPYCGTGLVVDENAEEGTIPDACIPFAFDKAEASILFAQNVKKKHFLPNKFKKQPPTSDIYGIYIPAFAFDTNTKSTYSGQLYNEYTSTDSDGRTHTERSYFYISGDHAENFEDVLVECSSKINQTELIGVLPYHSEKKLPYNNSYIMGYSVEHYSETINQSIPTYKSMVDKLIQNHILRKYHYDGVSYINVATNYSDEKYKYCLLPIYRFEYVYKDKPYRTLMNGQTGAIDSNLPKSKWKIAFAVLIPFLIILAFILIGMLSN